MNKAILALGLVSAGAPIMPTTPGWQLGNSTAPLEVRVFYDILCPDSMDAHNVWKSLLSTHYIGNQLYGDIINLKVTPFVLPYHVHSFQMT